jgi:hypothetical protein
VLDGKFTEGPNAGKERKMGRCLDRFVEDFVQGQDDCAYEMLVQDMKAFKINVARFILTIWSYSEQKCIQVVTTKLHHTLIECQRARVRTEMNLYELTCPTMQQSIQPQ